MLVASWCNTSRSFPPAETSHRLLSYTSVRNRGTTRILWSHGGGCTVGAEFCAERQTIAAKWLNCSQLNKCYNRIQPPRARLSPLYRDLVPYVSFLYGRDERRESSSFRSQQRELRIVLRFFFLSQLLRVPTYECVRTNLRTLVALKRDVTPATNVATELSSPRSSSGSRRDSRSGIVSSTLPGDLKRRGCS